MPHPRTDVLFGQHSASWRAVPKACGKWEMVYKRYQLWRAEGRWPRIAAALGLEEREVAL